MADTLLYSRGSHLSDVDPDFRGQPLADWLRDQITRQCNASLAKGGLAALQPKDKGAKKSKK